MKAWVLWLNARASFRVVRADAPCWKGEVVIPLLASSLVIGWQRGAPTP